MVKATDCRHYDKGCQDVLSLLQWAATSPLTLMGADESFLVVVSNKSSLLCLCFVIFSMSEVNFIPFQYVYRILKGWSGLGDGGGLMSNVSNFVIWDDED